MFTEHVQSIGMEVTVTSRDDLRQITNDKVTAAAELLFRKRGFKATTVRDIAAEAGVSVGSVMAIGDKSALLVAMFDRTISEMHHDRAADAEPKEVETVSPDPTDRIMELITPFLALFASNMDLAREYGAVLMMGTHRSVIFHELGDVLLREINATLQASGMNENDAEVASRTVYIAYLGTTFAWAGSGSTDVTEPMSNLRSILTFITKSK
ncbi:TetR/AcrR family transcriptional regulator [Cryobacterium sp. TMT1-66-1]|uniref:TetR/AcrR family transcriptional regulator n=1 Tax=Cryobacterium sp. TMT1-66-1 TaxID=1259242 RepID=UPI00141BA40B|nr:TetR/AcrR family transcriptional regulator [Cryobacterium sp. TMT1-66-1]